SRTVDQAAVGDRRVAGPARGSPRTRRCRLHRPHRRSARAVHLSRRAGPDRLSGPGIVDHNRRAVPVLDRRRPLAACDAGPAAHPAAPAAPPPLRCRQLAAMPISPSDRALGDLLVGRRVVTLVQLDEATALAERWNVRLGDALLSRNWIDPQLYYESYAR